LPGPHPDRELTHPAEHLVHRGHHIDTVDGDALPPGRAQRNVQHCPALGDVDLLAGEHGVDALAQARLLREPQQQAQRVVGDAVLRIVEVDAAGLESHPLAASGVIGEQVAQVDIAHLGVVIVQFLPGAAVEQRRRGFGHVNAFLSSVPSQHLRQTGCHRSPVNS
jgi:hypothetical protein